VIIVLLEYTSINSGCVNDFRLVVLTAFLSVVSLPSYKCVNHPLSKNGLLFSEVPVDMPFPFRFRLFFRKLSIRLLPISSATFVKKFFEYELSCKCNIEIGQILLDNNGLTERRNLSRVLFRGQNKLMINNMCIYHIPIRIPGPYQTYILGRKEQLLGPGVGILTNSPIPLTLAA
jgi:hypothetical protein